jgi:hypothetical protein
MSQSIHFARLKYFSEEFTKERNHDEILQELKKILKEEKKIAETLEKIIEDIEPQHLILSANTPEIEKFLTTGSEIILHPQSSYYFVTEKLWSVLRKEIVKQFRDIQKEDDCFDLARDCTEIEKYFIKKMLVFEAS